MTGRAGDLHGSGVLKGAAGAGFSSKTCRPDGGTFCCVDSPESRGQTSTFLFRFFIFILGDHYEEHFLLDIEIKEANHCFCFQHGDITFP